MELPDFLSYGQTGEIVFTGHRLELYHVVAQYRHGESAEMIACRYPSIPLPVVHRVIAFYLDNRTEVDDYLSRHGKELDALESSSPRIDFEAIRRRLSDGATSPSAPQAS